MEASKANFSEIKYESPGWSCIIKRLFVFDVPFICIVL